VVGLFEAGEDLEEGRFAGAIGAHETRLVALGKPERQLIEERPGPVGLTDRLAADEERASHPNYFFFCLGFFFSFCMLLPFATALTPLRRSSRSRSMR
jgi:hypothetical protein